MPPMRGAWVNTLKARGQACLRPRPALMLTFLILTLAFPLEDIMRERSVARHGSPEGDFLVYYSAAKAARQPGEHHLYADVIRDSQSSVWGVSSFNYPPFSAFLMEPLTILPPTRAVMVWKYALVLMTALAVYFTLGASSKQPVSVAALAIGVAAAFSFHPHQYSMFLGQMGGLILLAWALGLYLFSRGRPVSSAFCFAFGTVIKVAPIFVVPLLAIRRQWRCLGAYVGWVVALSGLSMWQLGWQPYRDWLWAVYPVISHGTKAFQNRSLPGLILWCAPGQVWGQRGTLGWEVKAPAIILSLAFYLWCWKKSRGSQGLVHELALAPLLYLLTSPVAWTHHFILALVPLVYLWMKSQDTRVEVSSSESAVLVAVTLVLGTAAPNYLAGGLNNSVLYTLVMGSWVLATLALIGVGMKMYARCLPDGANG